MTTPKIVQLTITDHLDGSTPEFSVMVGARVAGLDGQTTLLTDGPMSPGAALTKYGLTVDAIAAYFNGQVIADRDIQKARADAAEATQ